MTARSRICEIFAIFLTYCGRPRFTEPWNALPVPADCYGPVADPVAALLKIRLQYDDGLLERAGLIEVDSTNGIVRWKPCLIHAGTLIVPLRRAAEAAPFGLMCGEHCLPGWVRPQFCWANDFVTASMVRQSGKLLAAATSYDVALWRALGLPAVVLADVRGLSEPALTRLDRRFVRAPGPACPVDLAALNAEYTAEQEAQLAAKAREDLTETDEEETEINEADAVSPPLSTCGSAQGSTENQPPPAAAPTTCPEPAMSAPLPPAAQPVEQMTLVYVSWSPDCLSLSTPEFVRSAGEFFAHIGPILDLEFQGVMHWAISDQELQEIRDLLRYRSWLRIRTQLAHSLDWHVHSLPSYAIGIVPSPPSLAEAQTRYLALLRAVDPPAPLWQILKAREDYELASERELTGPMRELASSIEDPVDRALLEEIATFTSQMKAMSPFIDLQISRMAQSPHIDDHSADSTLRKYLSLQKHFLTLVQTHQKLHRGNGGLQW